MIAKMQYHELGRFWRHHPAIGLRGYPDGTLFLLKTNRGHVRVMQLIGNLPTDLSWKAQDIDTSKIYRLERQHGSLFCPLYAEPKDNT